MGMDIKMATRRPAILCRKVLTLLVACAGVVALNVADAQSGSWVTTRTRAHDVREATFVREVAPQEPVSIVVALKIRDREQLDSLVSELVSPNSPRFRQWLTHKDLVSRFAPTREQATAVASYLAQAGFTDIEIGPNNLLVAAVGGGDVVRRSFNTEIARFQHNGHEGIANTRDAQIPGALADITESILGLQTVDEARPMTVTTHSPVQFPAIYAASRLPGAGNTVVGIITEGNMAQTIADLHQFESLNGLPTLNPTVINVGGVSGDTSGTVEWDLDSQDIQGMAGGQVAGMTFYTATALTDAALTATYNRVVSDNLAKVINVSLGICETAAHNDGSMAADDAIFEMAIAQGQTFSVASGDWGSKECGSGINGVSFGTVAGESYPASSPYVIAVGATTLSTNADGSYASESAWTFSGGGPSLYEAKPSWQLSIVPGNTRGVPDVSFDGDPNSGAIFVFNGSQVSNGGTSLSSPLFVGSWARLESAHGNRLGFPGPLLYGFGARSPGSVFHDVTSGSNGDYSAVTGWDYVTGFGSLNVAGLDSAISGESIGAVVTFLLHH